MQTQQSVSDLRLNGSFGLLNSRIKSREAQSTHESELSIGRQLHDAVEHAKSPVELIGKLTTLIESNSDCLGLWLAQLSTTGTLEIRPANDRHEESLWNLVGEQAQTTAHDLLRCQDARMDVLIQSVIDTPASSLGFCPLAIQPNTKIVLVGCFSARTETVLRQEWLLTMVGQAVGNWIRARNEELTRGRVVMTQKLLTAINAIANSDKIDLLSIALANQCKTIIGAEQVFVGLSTDFKCPARLKAISDLESIDQGSTIFATADSLLKSDNDRDQARALSNTDGKKVTDFFAAVGSDSVLTFPLVQGEIYFGKLLAVFPTGTEFKPEIVERLNELLNQIRIAAHLRIQASENLFVSTRRTLRRSLQSSLGRKIQWIVAGLFGLLLLPWPAAIQCDTKLEPISRRFISAPFEGILESTVAKNGDRVQKGDLLGTLDGQTLRFELSGLHAELASANKKADQARAQRDIAEAQIQKSEAKRIQSAINSIETQLSELELRCPIDGVVISGDLDKAEGAKIQLGQNLFEIGPLDQMLVEIQIDEHEIRFVNSGDPVQVKFNAYPFRTWTGEIAKIHSRSEIVDSKNVFVAEVIIENDGEELQPGMRGHAKISNGWSVLGWIWFHRAYDDMRYWLVF